MGKRAKSQKGAQKAQDRKLDTSTLPPPPKAVVDEVRISGSVLTLFPKTYYASKISFLDGWPNAVSDFALRLTS